MRKKVLTISKETRHDGGDVVSNLLGHFKLSFTVCYWVKRYFDRMECFLKRDFMMTAINKIFVLYDQGGEKGKEGWSEQFTKFKELVDSDMTWTLEQRENDDVVNHLRERELTERYFDRFICMLVHAVLTTAENSGP